MLSWRSSTNFQSRAAISPQIRLPEGLKVGGVDAISGGSDGRIGVDFCRRVSQVTRDNHKKIGRDSRIGKRARSEKRKSQMWLFYD
jgi:hypothetical protein